MPAMRKKSHGWVSEAIINRRMVMQKNVDLWEWVQEINLLCFRTVHCMPKIPILLQTQPEIGGHAQDARQPQRRVRSHRTSAFNDFIETGVRNFQAASQLCLCKIKRLNKFL